MNKKIYIFALLLVGLSFSFASCLNTNNEVTIDEEWKRLNEQRFYAVAADASYTDLASQSGDGKVYWKKSTVISDSDAGLRTTQYGKPEFTDTVVVRYEGSLLDKTGVKYIFESTENPVTGSAISIDQDPNKRIVKFAINESAATGKTYPITDGWRTILQDMRVGDEREVCIPQELGYGVGGSGGIPGYTTLFFRIKLINIIPMKGLVD